MLHEGKNIRACCSKRRRGSVRICPIRRVRRDEQCQQYTVYAGHAVFSRQSSGSLGSMWKWPLAVAQAELGIIPGWAAEGIAAVAGGRHSRAQDPRKGGGRAPSAPIHALTRVVAEKAGPAGAYVHWGATTQNVMQTGRLILMQRAQLQLWNDFFPAP